MFHKNKKIPKFKKFIDKAVDRKRSSDVRAQAERETQELEPKFPQLSINEAT